MKALLLTFILAASFDADQERDIGEWSEGRPRWQNRASGTAVVVCVIAGMFYVLGRYSGKP